MSKKARQKLKATQEKLIDAFAECAEEIEAPKISGTTDDEAPSYYIPNRPDQLLSRIQQIEYILNTKEQHG